MKSPNNPHAISTSSISGTTVLNPALETIGSIKDIMIDIDSGEVLYAVLSVDTGFLNLDSKYFAIPLEEFEFRPEQKEAMLDVSKERLEDSPGFDKDNWPSGPQHEFVGEVYTYYGRTSRYEQSHNEGRLDRDEAGRSEVFGNNELEGTRDGLLHSSDAQTDERLRTKPGSGLF